MRKYSHRRTRELGGKAAMPTGISAPSFFGGYHMGYVYYNPQPAERRIGDCTVRAISKALGQTWEETYAGLALEGFIKGDLPNADSVWSRYLKNHGFSRHFIPDACPDCFTVADFAAEYPRGTYILSMPGRHVVTVVDGNVYDSWDSRGEIPTYFWIKER